MDVNNYKKPIQYLDTDLVTKEFQNETIQDLYDDIIKYSEIVLNQTADEIDEELRKNCLEYTLTGTVKDISLGYLRLIKMFMNDKNSSTLREKITIDLLDNLVEIPGKHFYDAFDKFSNKFKEIKPMNSGTLDGGGGITDFASGDNMIRVVKDQHLWNQNMLDMIVSGFVSGRIQYIIEFPYQYKNFAETLINYSYDRFEGKNKNDKINGNTRQNNLSRVFGFGYNAYKDCTDVKVLWINPNIDDYSKHFSQPFLKYLKSISKPHNILKFTA